MHTSAPAADPTSAPIAAPTGRAPYVAVTITAETRPSISPGVTACRSVVVLIVQSKGPAPIKKKLRAASPGDGTQIVSTITSAEASPASGPITTTLPNGSVLVI